MTFPAAWGVRVGGQGGRLQGLSGGARSDQGRGGLEEQLEAQHAAGLRQGVGQGPVMVPKLRRDVSQGQIQAPVLPEVLADEGEGRSVPGREDEIQHDRLGAGLPQARDQAGEEVPRPGPLPEAAQGFVVDGDEDRHGAWRAWRQLAGQDVQDLVLHVFVEVRTQGLDQQDAQRDETADPQQLQGAAPSPAAGFRRYPVALHGAGQRTRTSTRRFFRFGHLVRGWDEGIALAVRVDPDNGRVGSFAHQEIADLAGPFPGQAHVEIPGAHAVRVAIDADIARVAFADGGLDARGHRQGLGREGRGARLEVQDEPARRVGHGRQDRPEIFLDLVLGHHRRLGRARGGVGDVRALPGRVEPLLPGGVGHPDLAGRTVEVFEEDDRRPLGGAARKKQAGHGEDDAQHAHFRPSTLTRKRVP